MLLQGENKNFFTLCFSPEAFFFFFFFFFFWMMKDATVRRSLTARKKGKVYKMHLSSRA